MRKGLYEVSFQVYVSFHLKDRNVLHTFQYKSTLFLSNKDSNATENKVIDPVKTFPDILWFTHK